MNFHIVLLIFHLPNAASTVDPFAGLLVLAPCFEVFESAACTSSLPQSFQSQYPTAGLNDPDTKAYLFTPTNPDRAEQLHFCGGQLPPESTFDPNVETEIFIHGWLDGVCRTAWMREMKEQLFLRGKYNVILIDWSWGNTPDYIVASQNCRVAGEQVGFIIKNIMRQTGIGPEKFHVVGHSFGGNALGFVGRFVPVRRLTALDPALSPFQNVPPNGRLTYRDAPLVDVIHSNGGNCSVFTIGDERFLGHADFYPNGGKVQLSCYIDTLKTFLKGDLLYGLISLIPQECYHLQSIQYYKVSINPEGCEFVGVADKSYKRFLKSSPNSKPWAVMGMDYEKYRATDDTTRRKYCLKTKLLCPYYAVDPFAGLLVLAPCFEVFTSATCKSSLPQSFQSQYPTAGINDPDTKAYLFTPTNPDRAEQLHLCGGQLPPDSKFDPNVETEIFIHGWLDGVCKTAWMREMKEQLFKRGNYNVILIDWTWGNIPDLYVASQNCKMVGEQVGFIIKTIMRQTGVGPENFHVVGHSFGAIALGFVGRFVSVRRLTGLDPGFPVFGDAPPDGKLTFRDAPVVDIMHTNAGHCFPITFGDEGFLGHADFYPNGGTVQLSCYSEILKALLKGDILYGLFSLIPQFCYHLQAVQYYKVSINPEGCEFVGVADTSYKSFLKSSPNNNPWAVMGMDFEKYYSADNKTRRKYYLKTKLLCPYYDNSYLGDRQFPFDTSCS